MRELSIENEIRRRERRIHRRKHPVLSAVYLSALGVLTLFGRGMKVLFFDYHVWQQIICCAVAFGITAGVFYLLRKYPILRQLRNHPGIGAMLLYFLLGFFCLYYYAEPLNDKYDIWPVFMFLSVLIISVIAFATEGYWYCTPFFVIGSGAVLAMLAIGVRCYYNATLALLLSLVVGIVSARNSVGVTKIGCILQPICVFFIWAGVVFGFLEICSDYELFIYNGFRNFSVTADFWLDPDMYCMILKTCRFVGESDVAEILKYEGNGILLWTATRMGWGAFGLLLLCMGTALVSGVLLAAKNRGFARLLGTGAVVCLLFTFIGEPLRAFGIPLPTFYTVPLLSGDTFAVTITLLTAILVFPFQREGLFPYRTNFLYRELEDVVNYFDIDYEAEDSCMVMRLLPLPKWKTEIVQLFDCSKNMIHLKKRELHTQLSGKEYCAVWRYYGAVWDVEPAFEKISFRGDYAAVKVTANRDADAGVLLSLAQQIAKNALPDKADNTAMCIGIDNTLEDDEVSIHLLIL